MTRSVGISVCASVDKSTTPLDLRHLRLHLGRKPAQHLQVVAEDLHGHIGARSRQHVIDAMGDRLTDRHVRSRQQGRPIANLGEHLLLRPILHFEPHVDLGRLDALHMLVELGSASPPRRRRHFGHHQQEPLQSVTKRIRIGKARPRNRHRAHGQRTFVEFRKKGSTRHRHAGKRHEEHGDSAGDDELANGCRARSSHGSYQAFSRRVRRGSSPAAIVFESGSSHEHSTGVTVNATTSDAVRATTYANPSGLNSRPSTLPSRNSGRNTSATITVAKTTECRISVLASYTISRADLRASERQLRVLAQTAHDVLDVDDRVIDELADRDRQPAEAHAVDGEAEPIERDDGRQQRQWQCEQRNCCRADVHQKHDHDNDDEAGTLDERGEEVVQRLLDEVGAAEQVAVNRHALRQRVLDVVERRIDLFGELQRVRARLLLDADDDRGLRVVRTVAPLDGRPNLHGSKIAHQHGHGVVNLHDRRADIGGVREPPDAADEIFLPFGGGKSRRRVPVGGRQRALHVGNRHVVRLQAARDQ